MDIALIKQFFMWCTIINGALLILWSSIFILAPDIVYRIQNYVFPIPRTHFNITLYALIGLFKILFIVFSLTPYIALSVLV
ncbi:DUF6868 family protein [Neptunomonas sp.]|uniref:DUF6868 family protein n=1 Tax=Neptunomonas sp. TaxID=1971898 RepID=UPI00344DA071